MIQPYNQLASRADQRRPRIALSSASLLGLDISDIVTRGLVEKPREQTVVTRATEPSFEEKVFQALADAKIWTSKIVMHLERDARDRFFRQLDLLHDCDEWFGDENPVRLSSYRGFINFMLTAGRSSKPSLALSPMGALVAVWQASSGRLTIEFKSESEAQWVVSRKLDEKMERAAGETSVARLLAVLAPYDPVNWLSNA